MSIPKIRRCPNDSLPTSFFLLISWASNLHYKNDGERPGERHRLENIAKDRKEREASVRLGHKSLRTLMKRSSSWYLPGD